MYLLSCNERYRIVSVNQKAMHITTNDMNHKLCYTINVDFHHVFHRKCKFDETWCHYGAVTKLKNNLT